MHWYVEPEWGCAEYPAGQLEAEVAPVILHIAQYRNCECMACGVSAQHTSAKLLVERAHPAHCACAAGKKSSSNARDMATAELCGVMLTAAAHGKEDHP